MSPQYEGNAADLVRALDMLPIFATNVGYRTDSTPEEQALGEAVFRVHELWLEVRPT